MKRVGLVKSSIVYVLLGAAFASCTIEGLPSNNNANVLPGSGGDGGDGDVDAGNGGKASKGGSAAAGSSNGVAGSASGEGGGDNGAAGNGSLGGESGMGGAVGEAGAGGDGTVGPSCGDTLTSADNCGTCGHICACGKCMDGECQPTVVAGTAAYTSSMLTAAGDTAYFGYGPALYKLALADNTIKKMADLESVWGVVASTDHVYFTGRTGSGSIARVPKAGGALQTVASPESGPTGIDLVESGGTISVFWGDYFSNTIRGKTGSGAAFDVCTTTTPVLVTASDNRVYFGKGTAQSAQIHYCDVAPKAEGDLVTGLVGLGRIKRYKESLYWWVANSGGATGAITKRIIAGGTTTTPITNIEPKAMTIDDASIFYLDGSVIRRAGHDGTAKKKLTELADPMIQDLAVDNQCVYWLYYNGTIGRVDKD